MLHDDDELRIVSRAIRGPGLMVDVGAHHGRSAEPFARKGWNVLAIEPDPANRAVLQKRLGGRPNVTVDPRAIAETDGDRVELYTSPISTGISTLAPFHPSHRATVEVDTVRLDTLLAGIDEVTVLKTDLEGWDLPALRTFPWSRLHPAAVVSEFEDRKTIPLGYSFHDLARFLAERSHTVLVSEWHPVVEYGRRHRWRSLRAYPAELADPEGWGNVIATDADIAVRILRSAAKRP
jgi:FkbM family methyltransferase